ncbi:MinD/ParA family protein [Bacillus kexueae]|uniref:MinD/ParA family protein n=1 Tax=Aeribacillus kexueae TaxID=2078952 RepID=UPI001FB019F6|nr:MinD/ParA family protein [Bacillus kexueae]
MDQAEKLRLQLQNIHQKQATTYAVISGKGGVGKSNLVLNISLLLAKRANSVLVVDCDIGMANIDLLLGVPSSSKSLIDMVEERLAYTECVSVGPNRLNFLSGGTSLSKLISFKDNEYQFFFEQLEKMSMQYDQIFFDMGAGISDISLNFIKSVDEVLVVSTPEPTSIMDAYAAIKLVLHEMPDKKISLIVNRCQKRNDGEETWQKLSQTVKRFLHNEIHLLGTIPDDRHVQQAVMEQTPFTLKYPSSPSSKAVDTIASKLMGIESNESGFVNRLKKFFLKG